LSWLRFASQPNKKIPITKAMKPQEAQKETKKQTKETKNTQ
jgi:hypothetical protein